MDDVAKYRDVRNAVSKPVFWKYHHDECAAERHERRFRIAHAGIALLREFCDDYSLAFNHHDKGERFVIRCVWDKPHKPFCQWWPRTAKLVFKCRYEHGIHAHDVAQVIAEIRRELVHVFP